MATPINAFSRVVKYLTVVIISLLAIRVVDLQGVRGAYFRTVSEENRQFRVTIPAERGIFLDRYGEPLVFNTRSYFRYTDPLASYSAKVPITQPEALFLQATEPLAVSYQLHRVYTNPLSLAHVLGYTSVVNEQDLDSDATYGLDDVVGRMGLEKQYDQLLRGNDGYQEFEVNARGEKQVAQLTHYPDPGQPLHTTLDPYLSTVAWRAMGDKAGAVIIMDGETGELLTLVSTPSFNNNLFTPEENNSAALQEALTDERQLFFNRAVGGTYPPGSIFKLVTAAAGLESGAFDLDTEVDDQGILEVGDFSYANWYYTQYGRTEGLISLVRAITRSNDTFFYKAAEWTGVEKLVSMAHQFGFGEQTGILVPGERAGLVPDPSWKEQTIGERWFLGNTYHFGIGQGDLLVTPLQLAAMINVFGNGGKLCGAQVVSGENLFQDKPSCTALGLQDQTLAAIQLGMIGACSPGGTAFPFFDWNERQLANLSAEVSVAEQIRRGVVACKTGTAEFGGEDEQGYRQTHGWFGMTVGGFDQQLALDNISSNEASASAQLAEDERDLGALRQQWLAQVAKHGLPKTMTIMVLVESDENQPFAEGSREAAPIAKEIFDWLMGN